jgi:hypothetical protein
VSDIGRIWADAAQGNSETATMDAESKVRMVEPEEKQAQKNGPGQARGPSITQP